MPLIVNYVIRGSIHLPEGSKMTPDESAIILPNGDHLKPWEVWELNKAGEGEDYQNLSYDEVSALGAFFDGDPPFLEVVEE